MFAVGDNLAAGNHANRKKFYLFSWRLTQPLNSFRSLHWGERRNFHHILNQDVSDKHPFCRTLQPDSMHVVCPPTCLSAPNIPDYLVKRH